MSHTLHDGAHPRWLEVLPGVLSWGALLGLLVLSLTSPILAANVLIVYALFWLSRALLMSARLIVGYIRYRRDIKRDWAGELLTHFPYDRVQSIYHMAIVAVSKEDPSIALSTVQAIADTDYPNDRIIVVLATERRFRANGQAVARLLKQTFGRTFAALIHTVHPENIPGELAGKGSNITWAAQHARSWLDDQQIPYDRVICTTLDSDNRVHRKYFSALTYLYLDHPDPAHASFQPIPMFFNNIWEVPMPIRSVSLGSSFWQLIESTRPYRLRNFSAHAQSFAGLVQTEYWSTRTIVEDGHQYWRSYFRFNGRHDVVALSVPVYMDAVLSPNGYWDTFREQYLQKRRWAWGASDIPYVLHHTWRNPRLPRFQKWVQAARLIEGHFSWATTSLILALYSWLPIVVSGELGTAVIAFTFPPLYGRILTSALIGMGVTLTISMLLLPPRPKRRAVQSTGSVILEWLTAPFLLPISNILLSSIPALDAQTRLMAGRYLGYRVTEKHPVRQDLSYHPAAN
ncbi:glycosyltransferase family 2 protein [Candidatus Berkelbacteria bacterium]|nr:glycosyltransferase family 2 protein [Candidatus Berkelbacteria bacterium]